MTKWSFSGLKDFEQCGRKFHEVKVLKRYPKMDNAANLYGTALHKQAENYILHHTPLDKDFKFLQPILESLKAMPGDKSVSGGLLFVLKGTLSKHRITRAQIEQAWWRWRERVAKLEAAHTTGVWNPKQSGLCKKYCPVTTCEFQGVR
jgi:hypothetical protein